MRKICAKLVPKVLSEDQKATRKQISEVPPLPEHFVPLKYSRATSGSITVGLLDHFVRLGSRFRVAVFLV